MIASKYNQQTNAMKTHDTFDIKVALIGSVSVGKSTVLNALLGDTFSPVAFKQTTAGINSFRITQPPENEREEPAEPSPEQESSSKQVWLTIDEERQIQEADIVHKEISKDNKELGSSDIVKEKTFTFGLLIRFAK